MAAQRTSRIPKQMRKKKQGGDSSCARIYRLPLGERGTVAAVVGRAGGRRHYNAVRRFRALLRRPHIANPIFI
jgi:hypothetical protein